MRKPIQKLIALVMISCLVSDPVTASVFSHSVISKGERVGAKGRIVTVFQVEALAPVSRYFHAVIPDVLSPSGWKRFFASTTRPPAAAQDKISNIEPFASDNFRTSLPGVQSQISHENLATTVKQLVDSHISFLQTKGQEPRRVWGVSIKRRPVVWSADKGWRDRQDQTPVDLASEPLDSVYVEYIDSQATQVFGRAGIGYVQSQGELQIGTHKLHGRRVAVMIHNGQPRVGLHEWAELRLMRQQELMQRGILTPSPEVAGNLTKFSAHDLAEILYGSVVHAASAGLKVYHWATRRLIPTPPPVTFDPPWIPGPRFTAFAADDFPGSWATSPAIRSLLRRLVKLAKAGQHAKAAGIIASARELHTPMTDTEYLNLLMMEGESWLRAGNYNDAVNTLTILSEEPHLTNLGLILLLLGESYAQRGQERQDPSDFEKAYQTLRRAVPLLSSTPDLAGRLYYNLGHASLRTQRFSEAEDNFSTAINRGANNAGAYTGLGTAIMMQASTTGLPGTPDQIYEKLGRAIEALGRGLISNPSAAMRRAAFDRLVHLTLAIYRLNPEFALDPRNITQFFDRFTDGMLGIGLKEIQPGEWAEMYASVGEILSENSEFDRARTAFQEALQWDPHNERARRGLEKLGEPPTTPFASDDFKAPLPAAAPNREPGAFSLRKVSELSVEAGMDAACAMVDGRANVWLLEFLSKIVEQLVRAKHYGRTPDVYLTPTKIQDGELTLTEVLHRLGLQQRGNLKIFAENNLEGVFCFVEVAVKLQPWLGYSAWERLLVDSHYEDGHLGMIVRTKDRGQVVLTPLGVYDRLTSDQQKYFREHEILEIYRSSHAQAILEQGGAETYNRMVNEISDRLKETTPLPALFIDMRDVLRHPLARKTRRKPPKREVDQFFSNFPFMAEAFGRPFVESHWNDLLTFRNRWGLVSNVVLPSIKNDLNIRMHREQLTQLFGAVEVADRYFQQWSSSESAWNLLLLSIGALLSDRNVNLEGLTESFRQLIGKREVRQAVQALGQAHYALFGVAAVREKLREKFDELQRAHQGIEPYLEYPNPWISLPAKRFYKQIRDEIHAIAERLQIADQERQRAQQQEEEEQDIQQRKSVLEKRIVEISEAMVAIYQRRFQLEPSLEVAVGVAPTEAIAETWIPTGLSGRPAIGLQQQTRQVHRLLQAIEEHDSILLDEVLAGQMESIFVAALNFLVPHEAGHHLYEALKGPHKPKNIQALPAPFDPSLYSSSLQAAVDHNAQEIVIDKIAWELASQVYAHRAGLPRDTDFSNSELAALGFRNNAILVTQSMTDGAMAGYAPEDKTAILARMEAELRVLVDLPDTGMREDVKRTLVKEADNIHRLAQDTAPTYIENYEPLVQSYAKLFSDTQVDVGTPEALPDITPGDSGPRRTMRLNQDVWVNFKKRLSRNIQDGYAIIDYIKRFALGYVNSRGEIQTFRSQMRDDILVDLVLTELMHAYNTTYGLDTGSPGFLATIQDVEKLIYEHERIHEAFYKGKYDPKRSRKHIFTSRTTKVFDSAMVSTVGKSNLVESWNRDASEWFWEEFLAMMIHGMRFYPDQETILDQLWRRYPSFQTVLDKDRLLKEVQKAYKAVYPAPQPPDTPGIAAAPAGPGEMSAERSSWQTRLRKWLKSRWSLRVLAGGLLLAGALRGTSHALEIVANAKSPLTPPFMKGGYGGIWTPAFAGVTTGWSPSWMAAATSLSLFLYGAAFAIARIKAGESVQKVLNQKHAKLIAALRRDHEDLLEARHKEKGWDIHNRNHLGNIMREVVSQEEEKLVDMPPPLRILKIVTENYEHWDLVYEVPIPTAKELQMKKSTRSPSKYEDRMTEHEPFAYAKYFQRKDGLIVAEDGTPLQFNPEGNRLLQSRSDPGLRGDDPVTLEKMIIDQEPAPILEEMVMREAVKQTGHSEILGRVRMCLLFSMKPLAPIPDYVSAMVKNYYQTAQPPEYAEAPNEQVKKGLVLLKTEEILGDLAEWFKGHTGSTLGLDYQALAMGLYPEQKKSYAAAKKYLEERPSVTHSAMLITGLAAIAAAGWGSTGILLMGVSLAAGLAAGYFVSKVLAAIRIQQPQRPIHPRLLAAA